MLNDATCAFFLAKRSFSSIYFPVLLGGSAPPNVVNTIFFISGYKGITLPNTLMPSFLKSEKNRAIDAISKKKSEMMENWNISENRGGPEVFLEIASIAQFLSEIKKEGIKLFRRAILFYPGTKTIGIHHIRGGESVHFLDYP